MTRKDFELIAATIASLVVDGVLETHEQVEGVVSAFTGALAGTNPRFDRERFIEAATGGLL